MATLSLKSNRGTNAVKKLREEKLKKGFPFMINAKELATNQCYLEYPNGSIQLITSLHSTRDLNVIKELTLLEANDLRKRFHFTSKI
jgi:hypothetical protein